MAERSVASNSHHAPEELASLPARDHENGRPKGSSEKQQTWKPCLAEPASGSGGFGAVTGQDDSEMERNCGGDGDDAELIVCESQCCVSDERAGAGERVGTDRIGGRASPPPAGGGERHHCQKRHCDDADDAVIDGPLERGAVELKRRLDAADEPGADGGIDEWRHPRAVADDGTCEEQARAALQHAQSLHIALAWHEGS